MGNTRINTHIFIARKESKVHRDNLPVLLARLDLGGHGRTVCEFGTLEDRITRITACLHVKSSQVSSNVVMSFRVQKTHVGKVDYRLTTFAIEDVPVWQTWL